MKTLTLPLILSFVLFSCISVTGQSLKVLYNKTSATDMSELSPELSKLSQQKIIQRYSLTILNGISKYSLDSIFVFHDQSGLKQYSPYHVIYKDYNEGLWLEETGRYKEGYLYEQNLDLMRERNARWQWNITGEQKTIAGILCTKAVAKNGDIAWFAPDIPYLDGPHDGVFSLPGLVLSYENSFGKWTAISIKLGSEPVPLPDGQRSTKRALSTCLTTNGWRLGRIRLLSSIPKRPRKPG